VTPCDIYNLAFSSGGQIPTGLMAQNMEGLMIHCGMCWDQKGGLQETDKGGSFSASFDTCRYERTSHISTPQMTLTPHPLPLELVVSGET